MYRSPRENARLVRSYFCNPWAVVLVYSDFWYPLGELQSLLNFSARFSRSLGQVSWWLAVVWFVQLGHVHIFCFICFWLVFGYLGLLGENSAMLSWISSMNRMEWLTSYLMLLLTRTRLIVHTSYFFVLVRDYIWPCDICSRRPLSHIPNWSTEATCN